jgi:hypothetical protein
MPDLFNVVAFGGQRLLRGCQDRGYIATEYNYRVWERRPDKGLIISVTYP